MRCAKISVSRSGFWCKADAVVVQEIVHYTNPDVSFCASERSYFYDCVYVGTQLHVDETKEPRNFLAQIKCHY